MPDVSAASPMIVAPILVGDEVPAYLLTLSRVRARGRRDLRMLVAEHGAAICGAILGRERVAAAAAARAREDLIEGLLSRKGSDVEEVLRWARHLGYGESGEHRVLSLVVEEGRGGLGTRVPVAVEQFFGTTRRTRSSWSVIASVALVSRVSFSLSTAAAPQRVVSFLNVVGCVTFASSDIRQNRSRVIESATSRHSDS
jgi:hypothetical protein